MGEERGIAGVTGASSDPARDPRTNMFIAAVLEWGQAPVPITIRNLSEGGALVEGATLPPTGSAVRLVRGSLSASGTVAWVDGRRCGLRIDEPVAVALWMAKPGNLRQAEIDSAVQRIKAGQPVVETRSAPPAAPDLVMTIRQLEAQLAVVSDDLASAPETVARHASQLQKLDLLAQGLARLRGLVGDQERRRAG